MKTVRLTLVTVMSALATVVNCATAGASMPPPDPPLGPPPPPAIPLSAGPGWFETSRWLLVGVGSFLALVLLACAVLLATRPSVLRQQDEGSRSGEKAVEHRP